MLLSENIVGGAIVLSVIVFCLYQKKIPCCDKDPVADSVAGKHDPMGPNFLMCLSEISFPRGTHVHPVVSVVEHRPVGIFERPKSEHKVVAVSLLSFPNILCEKNQVKLLGNIGGSTGFSEVYKGNYVE